jgi:hypothetical protein
LDTNYIIFKNDDIFKKNKISKEKKKLWREIENQIEYFKIFYFSTWNLQSKVIVPHCNVELAMALQYKNSPFLLDSQIYRNVKESNLQDMQWAHYKETIVPNKCLNM